MSGSRAVEIKGGHIVVLEGCESWPCRICERPIRMGDPAYFDAGGSVVHADPNVCPINSDGVSLLPKVPA